MFYTDVQRFKNKILLRGYDHDGVRVQEEIAYKPYLFIPSNKKDTKYTSVYKEPLARMDFESIYAAKDFVKRYKDVSNFKIYGMDRFEYSFISDTYPGTINYQVDRIKIMGIDIEVDSTNGFPDIELADREINAITFRIGNERTVLGLRDFDKNKCTRIKDINNIFYYKFDDEKSLLISFINLWVAADIDVVTGWNIEFFDIPYIIRRIRQVLGEEYAKKLSPWLRLDERKINIRGRDQIVYYPVGIAVLDYVQLYKKFITAQRESYSLNFISHYELKIEKMNYSQYENLQNLYNKNPQLFYEYNIVDVDLIFQLEDKLRFIELVFAMAYDAKVNYIDALGSVLLWDVIIMNYLMERNIAVSPSAHNPPRKFEGGYVKDPQKGMHDWVVSFDLASLYPHLIMQYNISPEVFEGKDPDFLQNYPIEKLIATPVDFHKEQIYGQEDKGLTRQDTYSVTANGCYYNKEKYGFLPALMASQFKIREEYKDKMKVAKKKLVEEASDENEKEVARYHNAQLAKKIQLNSLYGSLANNYFRWYDPDHAEAITLSGQLSIRWIASAVNDYMCKLMKKEADYIIAIDTDSIYVNFNPLIKLLNPKDPVSFLDTISKQKIEPFMHKKYDELAFNMNAYANKMVMKREAIADKAIWRAKKNYIAHVLDNEGVRYAEPELKMMGIETVKSSTPAICREKIKQAIKLIVTADEKTTVDFILKFKEEFKALPFEDIASPRSVKKLSKYKGTSSLYVLGAPAHAKAALVYNDQLIKHKLSKKYSPVYNMDKIKWAYLKIPNPTYEEAIGVPSVLPKEFGLNDYIDYDLMFDKYFLSPIKSILDVIGWEIEKRSTLDAFFS